MSTILNVEKNTEISINIQIDYVKCKCCGDELEITATTDQYGDIQIEVEPHNCEE